MKKTYAMNIFLMTMLMLSLFATMLVSAEGEFTITATIPLDGATGVSLSPALSIQANCTSPTGHNFTCLVWAISDDGYVQAIHPVEFKNDTINWNINCMTYGHTYSWGVNCSNATNNEYTNETFTFTTEEETVAMTTTNYLTTVILPLLIAVAIFGLIVSIIFTVGITKETLIGIMITIIIAIVVIQVIVGL